MSQAKRFVAYTAGVLFVLASFALAAGQASQGESVPADLTLAEIAAGIKRTRGSIWGILASYRLDYRKEPGFPRYR